MTIVHTPGGPQELLVVNESGLYNLIFTSRKPAAKRFRRWVTHEVLPAIRKTGKYETGPQAQAQLPNQNGQAGVSVSLPGPGRFTVTVSENGAIQITDCKTEERRLLDLEQKDADRRFHALFRDGAIHPDFLLGILFGRHWPNTDDTKFRYFFDETCLAAGIQDQDRVLSFIPEGHRALVAADTFQWRPDRWAITEEAVYILAFLSKKETMKELETLRQANKCLALTNKTLAQTVASITLICTQYKDVISYHADEAFKTLWMQRSIPPLRLRNNK